MSEDIESQLRAALRTVAPREEFSQQLVANIASQQLRARATQRRAARWQPLAWWFSASLAASLVLAVGVHQHLQQQRLQQSGLEARREVLEALRVTSQKLNLAYEAVHSQSTSLTDEGNSA
jgi:anti-sigma-K factor RskA